MAERITFRFDSLDNIFLQDLDVRAESHPDACFTGIWTCPDPISTWLKWSTLCHSDWIHLQRCSASFHLDLSCQLLPRLFLCEYSNPAFSSRHWAVPVISWCHPRQHLVRITPSTFLAQELVKLFLRCSWRLATWYPHCNLKILTNL